MTTALYASVDRKDEWRQCYLKAMGYDDWIEQDATAEPQEPAITVVNLLPPSTRPANQKPAQDSAPSISPWMATARQIESNLKEMSSFIETKKLEYVSVQMADHEAALIQSTVTSFAATTASELESLRQLATSGDSDMALHQSGIVQILMSTLREQVADVFGKLQKQRKRRAVHLWQHPLQFSLAVKKARKLKTRTPPADSMDAVLGLDDDDDDDDNDGSSIIADDQRFFPTRPLHRLHADFLSQYEQPVERPPPVQPFRRRYQVASSETPAVAPVAVAAAPTRLQPPARKPLPPHVTRQPALPEEDAEETDTHERLQQEALLLTALTNNDLDAVQQMERSMMDITTLLAQFANLVTEQQEEVWTIRETAQDAKENVTQGQEELIKAKERTQASQHYTATAIFVLSCILLLFHTLRP